MTARDRRYITTITEIRCSFGFLPVVGRCFSSHRTIGRSRKARMKPTTKGRRTIRKPQRKWTAACLLVLAQRMGNRVYLASRLSLIWFLALHCMDCRLSLVACLGCCLLDCVHNSAALFLDHVHHFSCLVL